MSLEILNTIAYGAVASSIASLLYPIFITLSKKLKNRFIKRKGAKVTIKLVNEKGIEKEISFCTDSHDSIAIDGNEIKEINTIL